MLESRVPLYLTVYPEGPADMAFTGQPGRARRWTRSWPISAARRSRTTPPLLELLKPVSPRHGYGFSMEHLASSHYFLAADSASRTSRRSRCGGGCWFNCAHHIAHAWVPKRAYGEG